jgi:hypothetical protein
MEPLPRINLLDFDDTTFAPTYGVDGMHLERPVAN